MDAVRVNGNGDELRLRNMEGLQRAEEAGLLNEHDVAGIDDGLAEQVEALHGAGQREDVIEFAVEAIAGENVIEICAAQRHIAFCRTVLQENVRLFEEKIIGDLTDDFLREACLGGVAAAERDDRGIAQKLEEFSDRTAGNALHTFCYLHK